jgi:hypothetical protein
VRRSAVDFSSRGSIASNRRTRILEKSKNAGGVAPTSGRQRYLTLPPELFPDDFVGKQVGRLIDRNRFSTVVATDADAAVRPSSPTLHILGVVQQLEKIFAGESQEAVTIEEASGTAETRRCRSRRSRERASPARRKAWNGSDLGLM